MSFFAIALTTISCSKDDDEKSIEGKWIISQTGRVVDGKEVLTTYEHTAGCSKDYTIFNGGNASDYEFSKLDNVCKEKINTYTYTREGNKLNIKIGSASQTGTILNLTDTELKVSASNSGSTEISVLTKG